MVKKTIVLLVLYFFATLLVCGGKNILPNLTNSQEQEPVFFGPLEPEPHQKKIPGAGAEAAWEKNQEPEPLEEKNQEPEPVKNLPAPQPCL